MAEASQTLTQATRKTDRYWFPAKRYGWGWGPPTTWQGWLVTSIWLVVILLGAIRLLPNRPLAFAVLTLAMGLVLILTCWITGEPPAWRWGDRQK